MPQKDLLVSKAYRIEEYNYAKDINVTISEFLAQQEGEMQSIRDTIRKFNSIEMPKISSPIRDVLISQQEAIRNIVKSNFNTINLFNNMNLSASIGDAISDQKATYRFINGTISNNFLKESLAIQSSLGDVLIQQQITSSYVREAMDKFQKSLLEFNKKDMDWSQLGSIIDSSKQLLEGVQGNLVTNEPGSLDGFIIKEEKEEYNEESMMSNLVELFNNVFKVSNTLNPQYIWVILNRLAVILTIMQFLQPNSNVTNNYKVEQQNINIIQIENNYIYENKYYMKRSGINNARYERYDINISDVKNLEFTAGEDT
ncbi:hypothetical protein ACFFGV_10000 [Pontibacillus salicampi]|uniref:LXG domain-containing protein n=2 Tax=Pontibacillus salicampi TaxID=1449801 RepID=A0ABV6LNM5_9BACI